MNLEGWWPVMLSIGAVGLLLLVYTALYNGLAGLRAQVEAAWREINALLLRRHDLIPGLVEAVKVHAAHERGPLDSLARAPTEAERARIAGDVSSTVRGEEALTPALARVIALGESHSGLAADSRFRQLEADLALTERELGVARRRYDDCVAAYNDAVGGLPTNVVASWARFRPRVAWSGPHAPSDPPVLSGAHAPERPGP